MGAFDILEMRVKDATEFGDIDASCWQTKGLACRQHVYQVVDGKLYITQNRLTRPFKFLSDFTGIVEIAHSEVKNDAGYALCFREGILKEMYRTFNWCRFENGKSNYPLCADIETLEAKYPNNEKDE